MSACGSTSHTVSESLNSQRYNSDPSSSRAYHHFLIAEHAFYSDELEQAATSFANAIQFDPDENEIRIRHAEVLIELERFEEAFETLEDIDENDDIIVILRAQILEHTENITEALRHFTENNDTLRTKDFFLAWLDMARSSTPSDVQIAAENFTQAHSEDPMAWIALAEATTEQNDFERALEAYETSFALTGGSALQAQAYIELLEQLERTEEALAATEMCISRFREHVDCYISRVIFAYQLSSPITADAIAELAAISSSSIRLMQQTTNTLYLHNPEIARELLNSVTSMRPFNIAILMGSARVAYWNNDKNLSINYMQRALDLDQTNVDALNFIGYTWAELNENLEQAEIYVLEALMIRPNDPNIMDSLAWIYYKMERFDEALEIQLQAVQNSESSVLLAHLGDIYFAIGNPDQARSAWNEALENLTNNEELRLQLEEKLRGNL